MRGDAAPLRRCTPALLIAGFFAAGTALAASHHTGEAPLGARVRANTPMAREIDALRADVGRLKAQFAHIARSADPAERRRLIDKHALVRNACLLVDLLGRRDRRRHLCAAARASRRRADAARVAARSAAPAVCRRRIAALGFLGPIIAAAAMALGSLSAIANSAPLETMKLQHG